MLSNLPTQHMKPSTHSLIDRTRMQIETLASRESNYYEDMKREERNFPDTANNQGDLLNSYERLEQCKKKSVSNLILQQ